MRSIFRLANRTACLSPILFAWLIATTNVAAGVPADQEPWIPNYAQWMGDMADEIGDRSLMQLPLPGTHQSLTYDLGFDKAPDLEFDVAATLRGFLDSAPVDICSPITEILFDLCGYLIGFVDSYALQISYQWARNQENSVRRQLDDGIRVLDFRICIDEQDRMRGCHGLFTQNQASVFFNQVKAFLDEHPDEFIIMFVRATKWPEGKDPQVLADLIRSTFGNLLMTDKEAHKQPLDSLSPLPGRIYAISTGGGLDEKAQLGPDSAFIHPFSDVAQDTYQATWDPATIRTNMINGIQNRDLTAEKMLYSQTQMTFDQDLLIKMGVTWLVDREWDGTPLEACELDPIIDCWQIAKGLIADALDVNGFYLVPWGVLNYPRTKSGEPDLPVQGLWRSSMANGVAPIFDAAEYDPVFRSKVNIVSVDHYGANNGYVPGSRNGFVDAMIGMAGNGKPPLYVGVQDNVIGSNSDSIESPAINRLPAGLRVTLQSDDLPLGSSGAPMVNGLVPIIPLPPTYTFPQASFVGMALAMLPGDPDPVAGWTEVVIDSSDEVVEFQQHVVRLQQIGGFGGPLPLSKSTPIDFNDAVGAPTMAVHRGRFYIAYATLVENELHPRMKLRSAPLPTSWDELSPADFDREHILDGIQLPIMANGEQSFLFDTLCGELVFPQPRLVSRDGDLIVVWAAPGSEAPIFGIFNPLEPETETSAYCNQRFGLTGEVWLAFLDVSGADPLITNASAVYAGVDPFLAEEVVFPPVAVVAGGRVFIGIEADGRASPYAKDHVALFEVEGFGSSLLEYGGIGDVYQPFFYIPGSMSLFGWEGQLMLAYGGEGTPVDVNAVTKVFNLRIGETRGVSSARTFSDEAPKPLSFASPQQASIAAFTVGKDFSDDNPNPVTVAVTCAENPPTDSITALDDQATEDDPALFEIAGFYSEFGASGTTCSATESRPIGYSADETDCTNVFIPEGGAATCEIVNTQKPVIIRAAKTYEGGSGPAAVFQATCDSGTLTVINDTAIPGTPAEFELSDFPWDGTTCSVTEPLPPGGYYQSASTCDDLAIVPSDEPTACVITNAVTRATFLVTKTFDEAENPTPVNVGISCNTGLPLDQSATITQGDTVKFVVTHFDEGTLNCDVTEQAVEGYLTVYEAQGPGSAADENGCHFGSVGGGTEGVCNIANKTDPVAIEITKEWITEGNGGDMIDRRFRLALHCAHVQEATPPDPGCEVSRPQGTPEESYCMVFEGQGNESFVANVTPMWPEANCRVVETVFDPAVEQTDNGCDTLTVSAGSDADCLIVNTVFFEGIPALDRHGKMLLALLLLCAGFIAYRRVG